MNVSRFRKSLSLLVLGFLTACDWPGTGEPYPGDLQNGTADQILCIDITDEYLISLYAHESAFVMTLQERNDERRALRFEGLQNDSESSTQDEFWENEAAKISISKAASTDDKYSGRVDFWSPEVGWPSALTLVCTRPSSSFR